MSAELIIELVKSLSSEDGAKNTKHVTVKKGRYIVLGNRGNVVVGDLSIKGGSGILSNASVIRRWGTTKGLGQLAIDGATDDTIIDPCGSFEFELLTTCGMIPVKSDL